MRSPVDIGEAAVRATEAGHDLILLCHELALQRKAFDALCEAVKTGRLDRRELETNVARIELLRQRYLA